MRWRRIPFILFIMINSVSVLAQGTQYLPLPVLDTSDTLQPPSSLSLRISNQEFVYDAEYFYPLDPGYTLLGSQLQSVVKYRVSKDFSLSGGMYLLKYSGMNGFVQWRPVISATYRVLPALAITMGTLKGSLHHRLPEPLYKFDLSFTDFIEEGIQARLNTRNINGDYWIDWRNFIQPGDPYQEELLFGTSTSISLFKERFSWSVKVPLYSLVFHRGGQIDRSPLPVRTFGNLAAGIMVERAVTNPVIDHFGLQFTGYHYFDLSGDPLFPFTSGTAIYPEISVGTEHWSFSGGYWWTNHYFSLTGDPQFATVSESGIGYNYPDRELVKVQLGYFSALKGGPELFFFCNGYWDLRRSEIDYSIGLQLIFNQSFHLHTF